MYVNYSQEFFQLLLGFLQIFSLHVQNSTKHAFQRGGMQLGVQHTSHGAYAMLVMVCENDFWLRASITHLA